MKRSFYVLSLACITAFTSPAWGQSAPSPPPSENVRQIRTKLVLDKLPPTKLKTRGKPAVYPTLELSRDARESGSWRLLATPYPGGAVLSGLRIVEWIGNPYYTYETEVRRITPKGNDYFVMFRALPTGKDAPKGASTSSLVWLVTQPPGKSGRWRFISKATYSMLDGGSMLTLRAKEGKKNVTELVRTQENLTQRFCGIVQEDLFQEEIFDVKKKAFALTLDVAALVKDAKTLRPGLFSGLGYKRSAVTGYQVWQSATSDLRTPSNANTILRPLELGDQDTTTVWAEGAPRMGKGEFVTATIESALPMRGIRLFPGRGEDKQAFKNAPQPKRVLLGLSEGKRYLVELPKLSFEALQAQGGVFVELPTPVSTECMSVMILDAYPAQERARARSAFKSRRAYEDDLAKRDAVAISEVTPLSILYGLSDQIAAEQLLKLVYAQPDATKRQRLSLMTRAYSTFIIEALRSRLNEEGGMKGLERVATVLAALPSREAVPLLIELVDRVDPKDDAYRAIRRALAAHYEDAAKPVLDEIHKLPPEATRKRIDLLRLYGRVAPMRELQALVEDLGVGTSLERQERIRALASGRQAVINPLLEVLMKPEPDAKSKEHGLAQRVKDDAARTLAALSRKQAEAIVLTPDQQTRWSNMLKQHQHPRRRAVHLINASGRLNAAEEALVQKYYRTQKDSHLRQTTVKSFRFMRSDRSRLLLEAALKDPSPDVRIEAIKSLYKRPDRAKSTDAILAYASGERWPEGLAPALQALALLQTPKADQALATWIVDQDRPERAYLSAQAFERARHVPQEISRAISMLRDPEAKVSFELRRQLMELLALDTSADGESLLVDVITKQPWRPLLTERQHEAVQHRAILALGNRRSPRGKEVLLKRLDSSQIQTEQQVVLRALSFFVDAQLRDQLRVMKNAASDEQLVEAYDQAIAVIGRRLDVEEIRKQAQEAEEKEAKQRAKTR